MQQSTDSPGQGSARPGSHARVAASIIIATPEQTSILVGAFIFYALGSSIHLVCRAAKRLGTEAIGYRFETLFDSDQAGRDAVRCHGCDVDYDDCQDEYVARKVAVVASRIAWR